MSEFPRPAPMERRTVFVLAGLILAAIVSISFYHLDRHPAFIDPTDELLTELDEADPDVIFANDPVALAAAEKHRDQLRADLLPATGWPPEGTLFVFGTTPRSFNFVEMEQIAGESVWSVYRPRNLELIPRFSTATVETEDADDTVEPCRREAGGHHQCGDAGWTRVGERQITVDGDPTHCIWAHPMNNRTVRVRFRSPSTADDERQLVLMTALRDAAVGTGAPVDFEIHVDHRSTSHRHHDRTGWQSVSVPDVDGTEELIVEVSADDVGRRHTCFRFELQ